MQPEIQAAFWTTIAQVTAALSIAIVLDARGAARGWRKASRAQRIIESLAYASAGLLSVILIMVSVLRIRRIEPDYLGNRGAELFAALALGVVSLIVVALPVMRIAAKANAGIMVRFGKILFFPIVLWSHRRMDALEMEVRATREESDDLVQRTRRLCEFFETQPLGMELYDSAVEWGVEVFGSLLTFEPEADEPSGRVVHERHELGHALRRYDFTGDRSQTDIRARSVRIVKHYYIASRLTRLRGLSNLERIQAVREQMPLFGLGTAETQLIEIELKRASKVGLF